MYVCKPEEKEFLSLISIIQPQVSVGHSSLSLTGAPFFLLLLIALVCILLSSLLSSYSSN